MTHSIGAPNPENLQLLIDRRNGDSTPVVMTAAASLIGKVAFWVTVFQMSPSAHFKSSQDCSTSLFVTSQVNLKRIVNSAIRFYQDHIVLIGLSDQEHKWWMQSVRSLQLTKPKIEFEMDVREFLRRWDNEIVNHELIVRYVCGCVVSSVCTSVYLACLQDGPPQPSRPNRIRR